MTLTLELPQETEARLFREAAKQGLDAPTFVRRLIEANLPEPLEPILTEKQKANLSLLDAWEAEDATDDPESLRQREADLKSFAARMNANRAAEGRPPVYP